jgi:hypothetical protein
LLDIITIIGFCGQGLSLTGEVEEAAIACILHLIDLIISQELDLLEHKAKIISCQ